MRFVIHAVFSGTGIFANIKIAVWQFHASIADAVQHSAISIEGGIETGFKHPFGFRGWRFELQNLKRANLRKQFVQESEKALTGAGLVVVLAPFALVIRSRQIVEKFLSGGVGEVVLDLVLL